MAEFERVDKYFRSTPFPKQTKRLLDLVFIVGWLVGVWAAVDLTSIAIKYPQTRSSPLLRDGLLACASFMTLAVWSYARQFAVLQELRRHRTRDLCPTSVTLEADRVLVSTERRSMSYRWSEVAAIVAEEVQVIIVVKGELPFFVPARAFPNPEALLAFGNAATELWRGEA